MRIRALNKSYFVEGSQLGVLDSIGFEAMPGGITAIVGPSGCGKTTLLRIIGGLDSPDGGEIVREASEVGNTGYLFQEPRLLPWRTVLSNIELVLRSSIPDKPTRIARSRTLLEMVDLGKFCDYFPAWLSGGMRQRVSIARAFAYPSSLIMMDEPFQNLDYSMRFTLVSAFLHVWAQQPRTVLMVTHDIPEALLMADRIVQLSGRPARVIGVHDVEVPRAHRSLVDPAMMRLQATLLEHQH